MRNSQIQRINIQRCRKSLNLRFTEPAEKKSKFRWIRAGSSCAIRTAFEWALDNAYMRKFHFKISSKMRCELVLLFCVYHEAYLKTTHHILLNSATDTGPYLAFALSLYRRGWKVAPKHTLLA